MTRADKRAQGMNFESMWSVDQHSDLLFWIIALPVMAIVVPIFMWSDIERMWHYFQKRVAARSVKQVCFLLYYTYEH